MVAGGITRREATVPLLDPRAARARRERRASPAPPRRCAWPPRETGAGAVWVVGNAPTALFELIERPPRDPALIVGLPVGFVGAAEAKAALAASGLPLHGQPRREGRLGRLPRRRSTRCSTSTRTRREARMARSRAAGDPAASAHRCLSSAVLGGGLTTARHWLNLQVAPRLRAHRSRRAPDRGRRGQRPATRRGDRDAHRRRRPRRRAPRPRAGKRGRHRRHRPAAGRGGAAAATAAARRDHQRAGGRRHAAERRRARHRRADRDRSQGPGARRRRRARAQPPRSGHGDGHRRDLRRDAARRRDRLRRSGDGDRRGDRARRCTARSCPARASTGAPWPRGGGMA